MIALLPLLLTTVHVAPLVCLCCLLPPKGAPVLMDIAPYHIAQANNHDAQA